jgi:hypothetical protein
VAANVALVGPLDTGYAWGSLLRQPSPSVDNYVDSASFQRGAVYRVLGFDDGKYSDYRLIRAGGRLDSDMFPESIVRRSFNDIDHYARFLARRHVDYVWVLDSFDHRYHTNEHALLERWAAEQTCTTASIRITIQLHTTAQDVYAVEHCSPA